MAHRISTYKGLFGQYVHCKDGEVIGESYPDLFEGSYRHYDNEGNETGYSDIGLVSDYDHYSADGDYVGSSIQDPFGFTNHYDANGYAGTTSYSMLGFDTELNGGGDQADAFSDGGGWEF